MPGPLQIPAADTLVLLAIIPLHPVLLTELYDANSTCPNPKEMAHKKAIKKAEGLLRVNIFFIMLSLNFFRLGYKNQTFVLIIFYF